MAPEMKEVLDYLVVLLGPASFGGIALGFFGWMKARADKPHIDERPSVGAPALAQIGGMVMGQQTGAEIIAGLNSVAASYDRCTLTREAEMEQRRRIANDRHEQTRLLIDALKTVGDHLSRMRNT